MVKKFDFQKSCHAMLVELGAVHLQPSQNESDRMTLQTLAGPMQCKSFDDWLHCQFDDEKAAAKIVRSGSFNQFSGKWNWHFTKPTATDLEFLRGVLTELLVEEVREEIPTTNTNSSILLIESLLKLQAVKNPELAAKQARLIAILKRGTSSAPANVLNNSGTAEPKPTATDLAFLRGVLTEILVEEVRSEIPTAERSTATSVAE